MRNASRNVFDRFVDSIDDAVALLDAPRGEDHMPQRADAEPLPGLLQQCRDLCRQSRNIGAEPIRMVHHFACTGGTLISKCLASMPNVQLLSEVDPLSKAGHEVKGKFQPTDLIGLARSGSRDVDDDLLVRIFLNGLHAIHDDGIRRGLRIVLRDHTHSHFCHGAEIAGRPTLAEIVAGEFATRGVVTVRHPVDSYLALVANGWLHFEPKTIDEYARRYLAFLSRYSDYRIFRYEEVIDSPEAAIAAICDALELPFRADCLALIPAHTMSGDSGRSGPEIKARPRRPVAPGVLEEIESSEALRSLCRKLGYESLHGG